MRGTWRGRRRPRGRRAANPWIRLTFAALLAIGSACDAPTGPRQLSSPRLDAAAPFRTEVQRSPDSGAETAVGERFAERLRRRNATQQGDGDPDGVAVRRVRFPDGLTGELPREGWNWARSGDVSLLLHGAPPDALILAQSLSGLAQRRPAAAFNHFRLGVEPDRASKWIGLGSEMTPLAALVAAETPLSTLRVERALQMLLTPTLGRGLGFRADEDAYTGWRWLGENAAGTFLRLGRSAGVWQDQAPLPKDVERLLELLADGNPELADRLWQGPAPTAGSSRALMVLGTASRDDGAGAHLAVLCRLRPACPVTPDLARFLDSLAPPDDAATVRAGSGDGTGFYDLSRQVGLTLYTGDQALDTATLQSAVQATLTSLAPEQAGNKAGEAGTAAVEALQEASTAGTQQAPPSDDTVAPSSGDGSTDTEPEPEETDQ